MSERLSTAPSFDEQLNSVKSVESWGGQTEYVFIHPESSVSDTPILMASGWSEGRNAFKDSAREVYKAGRSAILVDHARQGGRENSEHSVHESVDEFHDEILHKANSLLEIIEDSGIDKVDVIAHSEGALNAVVAALQRPEKFNTVILAMPAGMIGEDSVLKLAGRFAPKVGRSLTKDMFDNPRMGLAINLGGGKYISQNLAKAKLEVEAMAETAIDDALKLLKEAGINIGVLQSHADTVFPANRIEENVRLDGEFANVDSYASVVAKNAGHDELLIHPERATKAALQMIRQFE